MMRGCGAPNLHPPLSPHLSLSPFLPFSLSLSHRYHAILFYADVRLIIPVHTVAIDFTKQALE